VHPDPEKINIDSRHVGKSGHSMTLRSHKNSPIQVNTASKAPKRGVMTDGKKKVTGNTTVKRISLEEYISVISGSVNSALLIYNTSLNSDPGEPTTYQEALNGPERDWWTAASIAEVNNVLIEGHGNSYRKKQ